MSAFIFPVLPGQKFPARKSPNFNTKPQKALSGKESRIAYRAYPLYEWELEYEFLSDDFPQVPTRVNLVSYSQDFTHWNIGNAGTGLPPVIVGAWVGVKAPDNTYTADRVILNQVASGGTNNSQISANLSSQLLSGMTYTYSVWLRTNDGSTISIALIFFPESGTPASLLVSVTPTWQRFVVTTSGVNVTSSAQNRVYIACNGNYGTALYADLSCWGAQVERGQYAGAYIPTNGVAVRQGDLKSLFGFFSQMLGQYDTFLYQDVDFNTVTHQQFATGDGATTNFNLTVIYKPGVGLDQYLLDGASNYPVLGQAGTPEWTQNTDGAPLIYTARYGVPELLSSASRTNLNPQSTMGAWGNSASTIAANAGTAPDGTGHATQLTDSTAVSAHAIFWNSGITITGGQRYTFSVWLKYVNHQFVVVGWDNGSTDGITVTVDLINGALSNIFIDATAYASNADAIIQSYPNGWVRVSITGQLPSTDTSARTVVAFAPNFNPAQYPAYAGTGSDKFLCWGAQFESGTMATAQIPTTTASVTAPADYSLTTLTVAGRVNTFQQVQFASAPANGVPLLWSGSFFYRVRFSDDKNDFEKMLYAVWALKKLSFEQILL